MKFILLLIFVFQLSMAKPVAASPIKCSIFCDVKNFEDIHQWQFESVGLESSKPQKETLVNCFQPAFVCLESSCSKNKKMELTWAGKLLLYRCEKSKNHKELLLAKIPVVSLLMGAGSIDLKAEKYNRKYFYKAVSGE